MHRSALRIAAVLTAILAAGPTGAALASARRVAVAGNLADAVTATSPVGGTYAAPQLEFATGRVTAVTLAPATLASGTRYAAVAPEVLAPDNRDRIRWLATNFTSVLGLNANSPGVMPALQAAVWQLDGSVAELTAGLSDPTATAMAQRLVAAALASTFEPRPSYSSEYRLSLQVAIRRPQDAAVEVRLSNAQSDGILGEAVDLATPDGAVTTVTTNRAGWATRSVPRILAAVDVQGTWSHTLEAGVFLRAPDGTRLMTVEEIPLRVSVHLHASPSAFGSSIRQDPWEAVQAKLGDHGRLVVVAVAVVAVVGLLASLGFMKALPGRRRFLPVALGLAAVAAGFLTWALWPQTDRLAFDRSRYEGRAQRLITDPCVEATSRFSEHLPPGNLIDGRADTSWLSGRSLGPGQGVSFRFATPVWVRRITVRNGLLANYEHNGRVHELRLWFDGGEIRDVELADTAAPQSHPVPAALTAGVSLQVRSYFPGPHGDYHSGGLAEVVFRGFKADGKDTGAARGRAPAAAPLDGARRAGEPICAWDRRRVAEGRAAGAAAG